MITMRTETEQPLWKKRPPTKKLHHHRTTGHNRNRITVGVILLILGGLAVLSLLLIR